MSWGKTYKISSSLKKDERVFRKPGLPGDLLENIVRVIVRYLNPERIIISGSRARGDYRKTSDIDIAIDCKGDIVFPGEILDEEVSTLLKFNIVNLRKVNKRLRREILREGITVYEKGRAG
ncbi:hypothetical protein HRbin37_01034 [bacterium HR37]|nr:hypothetical protein HRbin37_01034 [bacterium HR37]